MKTPTPTLITALRVLAREIQSTDGVANAAIAEAADRLEEMRNILIDVANARPTKDELDRLIN